MLVAQLVVTLTEVQQLVLVQYIDITIRISLHKQARYDIDIQIAHIDISRYRVKGQLYVHI